MQNTNSIPHSFPLSENLPSLSDLFPLEEDCFASSFADAYIDNLNSNETDQHTIIPTTQEISTATDVGPKKSLQQLIAKIYLDTYDSGKVNWEVLAKKINDLYTTKLSKNDVKGLALTYINLDQIPNELRSKIDALIIKFYNQEQSQKKKSTWLWNKIGKMICVQINYNLNPIRIRERYANYLDPFLDNSQILPQEASRIVALVQELKESWAKISHKLQQESAKETHRSPNFLKNWYKAYLRKQPHSLKYTTDSANNRSQIATLEDTTLHQRIEISPPLDLATRTMHEIGTLNYTNSDDCALVEEVDD